MEEDMEFDSKSVLLYAVTDRTWTDKMTLPEQIELAIKGGATCIQLREKELDEDSFLKEALKIRDICKKYNVPLIINDNVEIAIKAKADGVHVGQDDISVKAVRKMVGNDMIIGVSAHNVKEALEAEKNGADYLGAGAVFLTSTKSNAKKLPKNVLKDICQSVSIPVVAIGGINKSNMRELTGTGIDGVALISAIFASEDIENECRELYRMVKKVVNS